MELFKVSWSKLPLYDEWPVCESLRINTIAWINYKTNINIKTNV